MSLAINLATNVGTFVTTGNLTIHDSVGAVTGGSPSGGVLGAKQFNQSGATWTASGVPYEWTNTTGSNQTPTKVVVTDTAGNFDIPLTGGLVIVNAKLVITALTLTLS